MTLANILLRPDRAVLFTDTRVCDYRANPVGVHSKVTILPHAHLVTASRGPVRTHEAADWKLNDSDLGITDVDAAERVLPAFLAERLAEHRAGYAKFFGITDEEARKACRMHFWTVGRSEATGKIRAVRFRSEAGFAPEELAPGLYLNPPLEVDLPAESMDLARMLRVIEMQKSVMEASKLLAADGTGSGIGGEVIAVEIDSDGMKIRTVHRFNDLEGNDR